MAACASFPAPHSTSSKSTTMTASPGTTSPQRPVWRGVNLSATVVANLPGQRVSGRLPTQLRLQQPVNVPLSRDGSHHTLHHSQLRPARRRSLLFPMRTPGRPSARHHPRTGCQLGHLAPPRMASALPTPPRLLQSLPKTAAQTTTTSSTSPSRRPTCRNLTSATSACATSTTA